MINKVGLFSNFYNVNNSAKVQNMPASALQFSTAKDCFVKSNNIKFEGSHQFDYSIMIPRSKSKST